MNVVSFRLDLVGDDDGGALPLPASLATVTNCIIKR